MPSLDTLFTVKTVEVVQEVRTRALLVFAETHAGHGDVLTEDPPQVLASPQQLKATLSYLLEQVAKAPDAPTRADFDEYRRNTDARLSHLLDAKITADAAAAAARVSRTQANCSAKT